MRLTPALALLLLLPLAALAAQPGVGVGVGVVPDSSDPGDPEALPPHRETVGLQLPEGEVTLRNLRAGDLFYPVNLNNWWGAVSQHGDIILWPKFDWVDRDYDGLIRAVVNGKTGFLKPDGDWYIDPVLPYADRFAGGHAVAGDKEQGKLGYLDKAGKWLVEPAFDGALRFREGYAAVMKDDLVGFINVRGQVVIPLQYEVARSFHDGVAAVKTPGVGETPGRWGYLDKRGKLRWHDPTGEVTALGDFVDGYARVRVKTRDGEKWGYIDQRFKPRIAPAFDDARDFVGGVAAVEVDGKWGFIDKAGRVVIEPRFASADDLDETLVMVEVQNKFGYVNRDATAGVQPQFPTAEPFDRKRARVALAPTFGYIDVAGRVIWDPLLALRGEIIDKRGKTRARVAVDPQLNADVRVMPPPAREPRPIPYPPEHEYDEQLPAEVPTGGAAAR